MNEELKKLAFELDLPVKVVEKVYKSYWLFIKETIEKINFKEVISEEKFDKVKTSFNLPYLGKLYCNYNRLKAIKRFSDVKYKESTTNV